jgi:hypothetical protein
MQSFMLLKIFHISLLYLYIADFKPSPWRSLFKDYSVLYFGSSVFKILRLLIIALFSIHFFACAFYRVKYESAINPADVEAFYVSRNVDPSVMLWCLYTFVFIFC